MENALPAVRQLVEDFEAQKSYYLSPNYQESQVRQDFIDKFFAALGWDVTHTRQKNPFEQEVKIENKVSTQGSQRRADYAFFVAPNFRDVKFFAEAKKPHHGLASPEYYHQAIRYAWNRKTPIAVLTDFEEFHVLDCRYKPDMKTALDRKIEVFHYTDYADEEKFKRIFFLFGREAVAAGSIEKFAADLPKPRGKSGQKGLFKGGYQPVDEAFLEALDGHRDTLARSFKSNNPDLDGEELTEAVQRTLDRLVFMRFLEDKEIEDEAVRHFRGRHTLPSRRTVNAKGRDGEGSAWKAFISYSKSLEPKYNGLIFKPHRIIDADDFTPPDDDQFASICDELADPTSPYDFDKIPIWILGSIYERFLGKVVRATDKRAKVEEKPEVRKAGGVYYTPEYIVRYIVKETVGKLIEGKTPDQIAGMAFADIACGSGSFLLEVYSTLIEYHTRWYNENPAKARKADVETRDGKLVLSLKKLQEILTSNIYGVDIDFQATEVTQLSLYLRLLEDVTLTQLHLFKEKVLPDLRRNIVCGNSLIEPDIESQTSLFASDTPSPSEGNTPSPRKGLSEPGGGTESNTPSPRKVTPSQGEGRGGVDALKPMRFTDAFPDVMKRGGFDAIVGNPPYIRIQAMTEFSPLQVELLKKTYQTASKGNYDIYVVFVERALSLLNAKGQLGYILPHKFFNAQYGQPLRGLISEGSHLLQVVHFGDQQVFEGATTYTCLLFLTKIENQNLHFVKVADLESWGAGGQSEDGMVPSSSISEKEWNISVGQGSVVFEKLKAMPLTLGHVAAKMAQGIRTSANEIYVLDLNSVQKDTFTATSQSLGRKVKIEKRITSLFLQGKEIKPYSIRPSGKLVIIPYQLENGKTELINPTLMESKFHSAFEYLRENKSLLENREDGRMKGSKWYAYIYPKNIEVMKSAKILVPDIADRASFAFDAKGEYAFTSGYGIVLKDDVDYSIKYILGLLNSKILDFFLKRVSTTMRGGFFRYFTQFIEQLPIRAINFSDPADKSRHDHIVKLVEQMLAAKEKLASAKSDADVNRLEMQCEGLDRQIDDAVYQLYELTPEEIRIVEGNSRQVAV